MSDLTFDNAVEKAIKRDILSDEEISTLKSCLVQMRELVERDPYTDEDNDTSLKVGNTFDKLFVKAMPKMDPRPTHKLLLYFSVAFDNRLGKTLALHKRNYMRICKIILSLNFFTLAGCAAPLIKPEDQNLNEINSASLYISRAARFVNSAVGYRIYINGDYIGELWGGGQIVRRVSLGDAFVEFKPYEFGGIPSIGKKELSLSIEQNYEYHLQMDSHLDSIIPIGSLVAVGKSVNIQVSRKEIVNGPTNK